MVNVDKAIIIIPETLKNMLELILFEKLIEKNVIVASTGKVPREKAKRMIAPCKTSPVPKALNCKACVKLHGKKNDKKPKSTPEIIPDFWSPASSIFVPKIFGIFKVKKLSLKRSNKFNPRINMIIPSARFIQKSNSSLLNDSNWAIFIPRYPKTPPKTKKLKIRLIWKPIPAKIDALASIFAVLALNDKIIPPKTAEQVDKEATIPSENAVKGFKSKPTPTFGKKPKDSKSKYNKTNPKEIANAMDKSLRYNPQFLLFLFKCKEYPLSFTSLFSSPSKTCWSTRESALIRTSLLSRFASTFFTPLAFFSLVSIKLSQAAQCIPLALKVKSLELII